MTEKEMIESLNDEELYNFFDNICEEVSKLVWLESKLKSEIIRRELQYYKDEKNGIYRVEKCKRRYIFNDRER